MAVRGDLQIRAENREETIREDCVLCRSGGAAWLPQLLRQPGMVQR